MLWRQCSASPWAGLNSQNMTFQHCSRCLTGTWFSEKSRIKKVGGTECIYHMKGWVGVVYSIGKKRESIIKAKIRTVCSIPSRTLCKISSLPRTWKRRRKIILEIHQYLCLRSQTGVWSQPRPSRSCKWGLCKLKLILLMTGTNTYEYCKIYLQL